MQLIVAIALLTVLVGAANADDALPLDASPPPGTGVFFVYIDAATAAKGIALADENCTFDELLADFGVLKKYWIPTGQYDLMVEGLKDPQSVSISEQQPIGVVLLGVGSKEANGQVAFAGPADRVFSAVSATRDMEEPIPRVLPAQGVVPGGGQIHVDTTPPWRNPFCSEIEKLQPKPREQPQK